MGLSNEVPPNTATIDAYQASLVEMRARGLAARLVTGERNEAPKDSTYNAPNPNTGVRIRRPRLVAAPGRISVTQECADHNSNVAGVGSPDAFRHLWGEQG
jgi:hypothetical protein